MMPILKVENLSKDFVKSLDLVAKGLNKIGQNYKEEIVHAVDSVNFSIFKGEIVGVVGESGCGKSTLGRMVAGILQPTEGRVDFDTGQVKNKEIPDALLTQMIFQDPFSSLNPRKRVIDIITEAPLYHKLITKSEKRAFAAEMLQRVGLDPDTLERYPHQFSGGQRQRVNIARALALDPEVLILDEAVSALDKSVEAQVLNLLMDLKEEFKLTFIFISHDLNVVHYISDRGLVMYLGQVVEIGDVSAVYSNPKHPYTRALISAMPSMNPEKRTEAVPLSGDPPNPISPPSGCRFRTRCPFSEDICASKEPTLIQNDVEKRQSSACHMGDPHSGHSKNNLKGLPQ